MFRAFFFTPLCSSPFTSLVISPTINKREKCLEALHKLKSDDKLNYEKDSFNYFAILLFAVKSLSCSIFFFIFCIYSKPLEVTQRIDPFMVWNGKYSNFFLNSFFPHALKCFFCFLVCSSFFWIFMTGYEIKTLKANQMKAKKIKAKMFSLPIF